MPFDFDILKGLTATVSPLKLFRARDDTELKYRHYASDASLKLIMLHGSGSHSRYFADFATAIAQSGAAEVFTPDMRGHGVDPVRRGDVDYIEQLEDDVADLIAHIRSSAPGAKVILGGHSSGGGLAVRFAGSPHRDQVSGYLVLSPFLKHDAPTTRVNAGGWAVPRIPRIIFLSILNGFGITALNSWVVIDFNLPVAARDGTETLAYTHRLNEGYAPRDYKADLAAMDTAGAPLLLLVGDKDEAFVPEAFREVVAAHAPTQGRVEILPGESHLGVVVTAAARAPSIAWLQERT